VQVLRVTTKPKRLREIDKHVKVRPSTVKKVLSGLQHDPVLTLIKIEICLIGLMKKMKN
jgi:predicted transcriptional regulator with HTH domain